MEKWGIGKKLWALSSILIGISLFIGLSSFYLVNQLKGNFLQVSKVDLPVVRGLNRMLLHYRMARIELLQSQFAGISTEQVTETKAAVRASWEKHDQELSVLKKYLVSDSDAKLVANYESSLKKVKDIFEEVNRVEGDANLAAAEKRQKSNQLAYVDLPTVGNELRAAGQAMIERTASQVEQNVENTDQAIDFFILFISVCCLVSLFFGVLASLVLIRKLSQALGSVSTVLNDGSVKLSEALGVLASTSESLSSAASEQAAALQETSAAVEQINSMVTAATDNAVQSARASEESEQEANAGNEVMTKLMITFNDIQQSTESVIREVKQNNEQITGVMKMIQEIGSKTRVINDIVFQTKLLSFNASVEAARAGEHGKGFAVVAEEIGNLAQISGVSSKEIGSLLEVSLSRVDQILKDTAERSSSLSSQLEQVIRKGSAVAQQCQTALTKIAGKSSSVSQMVNSIAQSAQEQAKGVSEITIAIQEMNQTTESNSAAAGQAAAISGKIDIEAKEMNKTAQHLKEIIEGKAA